MARHLMAVCVVCLLCADHLPCHQHLGDSSAIDSGISVAAQRYTDTLHLPNPEQRLGWPADRSSDAYDFTRRRRRRETRSKRHSHDDHDHQHEESDANSRSFVRQLFERFGSPADSGQTTMNVLGFERMLGQLGLYELLHGPSATERTDVAQCMSSMDLVARVSSVRPPADHQDRSVPQIAGNSTDNSSNATDRAEALASAKRDLRLNEGDFRELCPLLLYQLTSNTSQAKAGCIDEQQMAGSLGRRRHPNADGSDDGEFVQESRTLVWLYAMGSILIASLCGLLAVAVIPCMESDYYHYLLQFFVALGVGTLAGDALLHLFPHAMMTRSAHTDEHIDMTLKGLTGAAGVAFSFLMERGLTMVAEWRKRVEKKEKPCSRVRVMRDPDNVSLTQQQQQQQQPACGHQPAPNPLGGAGEKLCKAKYSSYPYCYDEIDMETRAGDDTHHHHHQQQQPQTSGASPNLSTGKHGHSHNNHSHNHNHHSHKHSHGKVQYKSQQHDDYADTVQSLLPNSSSSGLTIVAAGDSPVPNVISDGYLLKNGSGGGGGDCGDVDASAVVCASDGKRNGGDSLPKENYTIILREHEAKHHGHSHTHGHVHSPPSSMSAVAWMVIMGDGMHNFTDGMAIGAAFSYNIAGGFSTALAVFCHELPHELGDFAILLKAGMSPRQALFYNLLSSVLSLIGTVIGIWIGDTPQASAWIFAAAAGMFLYIALVDMMPELTSSHKEESFAYMQLVLQMIGMLSGIGIMLLIALYEHDLKLIFSANLAPGGAGAHPH